VAGKLVTVALPAPTVSWFEGAAEGRDEVRQALVRFSATRDEEARALLLSAYQGLAYSLATRFMQRGEDSDDLNQVAMMGLLKAIDRFDPSRGAELTTFATATILGELKRHLRDRGWWVRPPRRVHDLHMAAQRAIDELTQLNQRSPTVHEVAEELDATVDEVMEALDAGALRAGASLEAVGSQGDDVFPSNWLGERDPRFADVETRLFLHPLLSRLAKREQLIVSLRFLAGWSQTEIAGLVGISQIQVSRVLSRSLAQLRAWSDPGLA
jgi:RNA polymerase sigma-B factor